MSKWTEFRDSVEKSISFDNVTDEMKEEFCRWLASTFLPLAQTAAAKFIEQVKAQAAEETGWNKARDLVVLPGIINGTLWIVEKALGQSTK